MKSCFLFAAAMVAGVAFAGVDLSITVRADAGALTALVSIIGGIATLAKCWPCRRRG